MYRTILRQQLFTTRVAITPNLPVIRRHYSILDTTKEKLHDLNIKVGKAAAHGLEQAEDVAESINETVLSKSEDVKKSVEESSEDAKADLKQAGYSVKKGVYEGDAAEDIKHSAKQAFGDAKHKGEQVLEDVKHEAGKKLN